MELKTPPIIAAHRREARLAFSRVALRLIGGVFFFSIAVCLAGHALAAGGSSNTPAAGTPGQYQVNQNGRFAGKTANTANGPVQLDGAGHVPSSLIPVTAVAIDTGTTGTLPVSRGGTGATTAALARAALGLAIGTDIQAFNAGLAAIAGLTSAADRLPYFTGSGTAALATLTSFGRSITSLADAAAARSLFGLVIGTNVLAPSGDGSQLTNLPAGMTAGASYYAQIDPASPQSGGINVTSGTFRGPTYIQGAGGSGANSRLTNSMFTLPRSSGFGPQIQDFTSYVQVNRDTGQNASWHLVVSSMPADPLFPYEPTAGNPYGSVRIAPEFVSMGVILADGTFKEISVGASGVTIYGLGGSGYLHADSGGLVSATTISKSDVGLSNVDNTSDANKPISTAQQTQFTAIAASTGTTATALAALATSTTTTATALSSLAVSTTATAAQLTAVASSTTTLSVSTAALAAQLATAGKVLQVVVSSESIADNTTSTSFTATSLLCRITPSATTSKILVSIQASVSQQGVGVHIGTIYRNGSNLFGTEGCYYANNPSTTWHPLGQTIWDAPASTSTLTYQVYFRTAAGGTIQFCTGSAGVATMILTEVAP